jgi:hypothetical protein
MKTKITLTNGFHGTAVNVVGELVGDGEHTSDRFNRPMAGYAMVRLTDSQRRRAARVLCGVDGCQCERHSPSFQLEGDPYYRPTCTVVGKKV